MKISVYVTLEEKNILLTNANKLNLPLSQYLLQRGLQCHIESNSQKAQFASIACQIYALADELDDTTQRKLMRDLGGKIYGLLEN